MVDHIHFQRILPSLSNSKRVKRADRKNKEQNNSSFKRFLKKNEHKEKNIEKDHQQGQKTKEMNRTKGKVDNDSTDDLTTSEKVGGMQKNDQRKRIDIHA